MLGLTGGASHRLHGLSQLVHAPDTLGRTELDLFNRQSDIDTEVPRRFHLSSQDRIPQALNHAGKFGTV